ncbi:Hypothetical protein PHPALM_17987, partial [Phytophthora palmivora]
MKDRESRCGGVEIKFPEFRDMYPYDRGEVDINEQIAEPAVERPKYVTPTAILPQPVKAIQNVEIA